jgi:hypothetical protein
MMKLPFLIVAATASFVLIGGCSSSPATSDGGTAGSGGSNAGGGGGGAAGATEGRGGVSGAGGTTGGRGDGGSGGAGGAAGGGAGSGGSAGGGGGRGGSAGTGAGGAAGTGAGGAAGGSFSCGDVTCGPTQVCVIQCCGGVPLCDPRPDGGVCTTVNCTTATGMPGCTRACTPPPRYCVDVNSTCGATLTCGCLPTGTCCSVISGRQALCACG